MDLSTVFSLLDKGDGWFVPTLMVNGSEKKGTVSMYHYNSSFYCLDTSERQLENIKADFKITDLLGWKTDASPRGWHLVA